MPTDVSTLSIEVTADQVDAAAQKLQQLTAAATGTETATQRLSTSFEKMNATLAPLRQVLEALGGAAMLGVISNFAAAATEIDHVSSRLGLTVERYQELIAVGRSAGVTQESMNTSLSVFARNLGQAEAGVAQGTRAFAMLGITTANTHLSTMSVDQALTLVEQHIRALPTPAQQVAAAFDVFGRSGAALVQVMKETDAQQQAVIASARSMGSIISTETAKSLEELNAKLTQAGSVMKASFSKGIADALPLILELTNLTTGALSSLGRFFDVIAPAGVASVAELNLRLMDLDNQMAILEGHAPAAAAATESWWETIKRVGRETVDFHLNLPAMGAYAMGDPNQGKRMQEDAILDQQFAAAQAVQARYEANILATNAAKANIGAQGLIAPQTGGQDIAKRVAEAEEVAKFTQLRLTYEQGLSDLERDSVSKNSAILNALQLQQEVQKQVIALGPKATQDQRERLAAALTITDADKQQLVILQERSKIAQTVATPGEKATVAVAGIAQLFPQGGATADRATQAALDAPFKSLTDQNAALEQQTRLLQVRRDLEAAGTINTTAGVKAQNDLTAQIAVEAQLRTDMYRNISGPELETLKDKIAQQTKLNQLLADQARSAAITQQTRRPWEIAQDQTAEAQRLLALGPNAGGINLVTFNRQLQAIKDTSAGITPEYIQMRNAFEAAGTALTSSFTNAIFAGKDLRSMFTGLADDLAKIALQALVLNVITDEIKRLFAAIEQSAQTSSGVGGFLSTLFGSLFGAAGGVANTGSNVAGSSHFAAGGIFDSPTIGLFGEAGPEAVVPLTRGPGGQLGLAGGGGGDTHIHQTVRVIDNVGVQVTTKQSPNSRDMDIVIDEMMAKRIKAGGATARAIQSTYKIPRAPTQR